MDFARVDKLLFAMRAELNSMSLRETGRFAKCLPPPAAIEVLKTSAFRHTKGRLSAVPWEEIGKEYMTWLKGMLSGSK